MKKRTYLFLLSAVPVLTLAVGLLLWAKPGGHKSSVRAGPVPAAPASLPGQTSTLLPDGRLLLLGGEAPTGPVSTATVKDPATGSITTLRNGLQHARAWHTATVLPDGTVLIFGGVGVERKTERIAELFDPTSLKFTAIPASGLTPRSSHTVTLLTDGRISIVGGVSANGEVLGKIEFWDPRSATGIASEVELVTPRREHTATLQADGTVLLWGGTDRNGATITYGEVFDPDIERVRIQATPPSQNGNEAPQVEATIPRDRAQNVPLNTIIATRFSKPLRVTTVNLNTAVLSSAQGNVVVKVVPAEGGMLAFLTPQNSLLPGTGYSLSLVGATDTGGLGLPDTMITFTTAGESASGQSGVLGSGGSGGDPLNSPWRKLPPLHASPGVTAISGQVLKLDGTPLEDVTLRAGSIRAQTDGTGRFLLRNVPSGHAVMVMDGRTASNKNVTYGVFEIGVDVTRGQTNALNYTIWMPQIDIAHAVPIPVPTVTETVISMPLLPGLEFHIPPGTTITDIDGKVVNQVSITPIPVSQPPFPLPPGVTVPIYFTIQPGGGYLSASSASGPKGGWLVYPNAYHERGGSRFDFWDYDADGKGWYVYGQGSVSANGRSIVPDPGVLIYELTGAMVASPSIAPGSGPNCGKTDGEPVDLGTGLFVYSKVDLYEPDVIPIALSPTYRQSDNASRDFGIGTQNPYEIYLVGSVNPWTYAELVFADGSRIYYPRIDSFPGLDWVHAVFQAQSSAGPFFGSKIVWNGNGWTLTRRDGTSYIFPDAFLSPRPQIGGLLSITDRNGNSLVISRDSNSNIAQIASPNGRWIRFTYDTNYRVTQAQDILGRTVTYSYDTSGRLVQVIDVNGGIWKYTYDSNNNMTSITDARGIVYLQNQYDAQNRVIKQTQADGGTYQFAYTTNASGNITETDVTDPNGNIRKVTFNPPPSFPSGFITGGTATGDVRAAGKPEQQTLTYQYQTSTNLPTSSTDTLGRTTSYAYDSLGNRTSVTRLAGTANAVTISFSYDPTYSQITSVTDPLSRKATFTYDSHGNLLTMIDPLGNVSSFTNDFEGRVLTSADPLGNTTQLAWAAAALASVTDPLSRSTAFAEDLAGRLITVTDPLGHVTQYTYNSLNEVTAVTDPLNGVTSFSYDGNGNLLSVSDAKNHATQYAYDNMDRVATRKDALLNQESYQHDGNGNLTQFTDRRGKVTTLSYDGLNRLTFAGFGTQPGPTYESTVSYTYDGGDRLTKAVDSISGTITRGYDNLDRLTSETTPQGSVSYAYDNAGRRQTMTVAGQPTVNYTLDSGDRLTQIAQGGTTVSFGYDSASRRTSLTLPNGIVTSYSYDAASQLSGLTYALGATTLGNLAYSYNAAGQGMGVGGSFARTGIPNAVTATGYNANNQLTTWGTANLFYDANGNMTSTGTDGYTWDAHNRLVSTLSGGSFQYDAFGRRSSKTIGGVTTNFLYDGFNVVQELSSTTPVANLLVSGIDEIFIRTDAAGARSFLTDAPGSTVALADPTGTLLTQYTYEPFGNTTINGTSANPFQYTGRENDGTGLYFYRARYYSPALQRFSSEDPMGFRDGLNSYAYVRNNPVLLTDPFGLATFGGGFSATGRLGPVYFPFSLGLALDSCGNIGTYFTGGAGPGVGAGGSFGWSWQASSALTICDLRGPFVNVNAGVGAGPNVSLDQFYGLSPNGPVVGVGGTVGAGVGAGAALAITLTRVDLIGRIGKRKCGC